MVETCKTQSSEETEIKLTNFGTEDCDTGSQESQRIVNSHFKRLRASSEDPSKSKRPSNWEKGTKN